MLDRLLEAFAPHICCSCGDKTALLCEYCEYDIISERFSYCLACEKPTVDSNLCTGCHLRVAYDDAWVVGWRDEGLQRLIDLYKFERTRARADVIARLLDHILPQLPPETVITYIPTIPLHRRQRGYDHMKLTAEALARRRSLQRNSLLHRLTALPQLGSDKKSRLVRQRGAFEVPTNIETPVLLLDDIYTTGATITAGVAALRHASQQPIFVGVVARQPFK